MRRWIQVRKLLILLFGILLLVTDVATSLYVTSAEPDDGKIYERIAKNVLADKVFSADPQPPLSPTIIRLPGYPLFLAGIYSLFGEGNDRAVHGVQGLLFFATAVFAGLLASNWVAGKRRRRRKAALAAFVLTGLCPLMLNYTGVLLTESATTFLLASISLSGTFAIKSRGMLWKAVWCASSGLVGGIAVEIRPDAGLFALGLGLTLVIASFPRVRLRDAFVAAAWQGLVFSLAFVLVLTPWTIRNYRVFAEVQPLAPAHAEAPGEFVPKGYFLWLRTWITDIRYVSPMLWDLEQKPIDISSVPNWAFTDDQERELIATLLDQYNNSDPEHPMKKAQKPDDSDEGDSAGDDDGASDEPDEAPADESGQDDEEFNLTISPEMDAAFGEIARRRIERQPFNYYVELPAIRATTMWFDTHSEYYTFAGELFPLKQLDSETYQNLLLPIFAGLVWVYTLLAITGLVMLAFGEKGGWIWALMTLLLVIPRLIFFSTLENPEPRYTVEYFLFAAVLGGVVLSHIGFRIGGGRATVALDYGRGKRKGN